MYKGGQQIGYWFYSYFLQLLREWSMVILLVESLDPRLPYFSCLSVNSYESQSHTHTKIADVNWTLAMLHVPQKANGCHGSWRMLKDWGLGLCR